ncbi:hypothetical protein MY11210_006362 [Beauveria gryllotalpidicola]
MMTKISALVALAALAGANKNHGGACIPKTITTSTVNPPTTTPTPDNCSTRTVCLDYVNECGIWYGGCVPDCKPWPTFSKPPCPSTTSTTISITATPTATTSVQDCHAHTICIDYVNECGMGYGGCIPACKPWPTFSKPPCPSTTTLLTVLAKNTASN